MHIICLGKEGIISFYKELIFIFHSDNNFQLLIKNSNVKTLLHVNTALKVF